MVRNADQDPAGIVSQARQVGSDQIAGSSGVRYSSAQRARPRPCQRSGLDALATEAGTVLATLVGQDLDQGNEGVCTMARRVSEDRVISTVDPQARHGHKTAAHGFDGYKGHIGIGPDSESITGHHGHGRQHR